MKNLEGTVILVIHDSHTVILKKTIHGNIQSRIFIVTGWLFIDACTINFSVRKGGEHRRGQTFKLLSTGSCVSSVTAGCCAGSNFNKSFMCILMLDILSHESDEQQQGKGRQKRKEYEFLLTLDLLTYYCGPQRPEEAMYGYMISSVICFHTRPPTPYFFKFHGILHLKTSARLLSTFLSRASRQL